MDKAETTEQIKERLDHMSRGELMVLCQVLDMIESRQSDPAPAQGPAQAEI